jgi:hypothetical protein
MVGPFELEVFENGFCQKTKLKLKVLEFVFIFLLAESFFLSLESHQQCFPFWQMWKNIPHR